MLDNPYSPPQASLEMGARQWSAVTLWNPKAAAYWSLLFSPMFGALIHMKNWQALERPQEARKAKIWAIVSALVIALATLLESAATAFDLGSGVDAFGNGSGIVLLVSWYVMAGRAQISCIRDSYGDEYARRAWGKPLTYAGVLIVGYFAIIFTAVSMSTAAPGQ